MDYWVITEAPTPKLNPIGAVIIDEIISARAPVTPVEFRRVLEYPQTVPVIPPAIAILVI